MVDDVGAIGTTRGAGNASLLVFGIASVLHANNNVSVGGSGNRGI